MSRLPRAVAARSAPRNVGDAIEEGAVIRAQVYPQPVKHGFGAGDGLHMRIVHTPAQPGCAARSEQPQRWAFTFGTLIGLQGLLAASPDLLHLYKVVRDGSTLGPSEEGAHWKVGEQMLRNFLVSEYDEADPAEKAEQVLVAFGALPRILPTSLL